MHYLRFIVAMLPVLILAYYIYRKDSITPEPVGQLRKGFFFGIISCILSLAISIPLMATGLIPETPTTIPEAIGLSFLGAAIPEECAKLFMLWILLRKNKYFDEWMDGIVYAVCISLGFAAIENVMYIEGNSEEWLRVGLMRALFSVPGHFGFGILMGYYYSLARFSLHDVVRNRILLIVAPVLAHGVYDSILFSISVNPILGVFLVLLFLFICHKLWKYGKRKVQEHLEKDREFLRLMDEKRNKQNVVNS